MLPSIEKSVRFQADLKQYQKVFEELPDGKIKETFRDLINQLLSEVRRFDSLPGNPELLKDKSFIPENRNKIAMLRQRISKIVEDYKHARRSI
jgi:hypothetical protein